MSPKMYVTNQPAILKTVQLLLAICLFMFSVPEKVIAQSGHVIWTQTVRMDADQAQSASNSMGIAILRVTADMKLTYKILVQKIDDGDMLTNAHIHFGPAGQDGRPFIFMAAGVQNLGKNVTIQLTPQQFNELVYGIQPIYINVHSQNILGDSIRGQIR